MIFLDHHSTTPVDGRVLEAMLPYFTEKFGNAASRQHKFGWDAADAVERARKHVAALIGATSKDIVFTSGATESNNLAIKGAAKARRHERDHIVTVATEHKAVLDPVASLEKEGWRVRKDGERFWANGELMPLKAADGTVQGFVKILRDRTEATDTEGATRRSRDELQVVTDALPVLISFIDKDHVYRFVNRHYETWFGLPAGEILDRHLRDVVGEEIYRARLPFMARALAGEEVTFDALMPYRDGATRQSEIRYIPRRSGARPRWACNITERPGMPAEARVLIGPADTAFTRMPWGPSS